MVVVYIILSIDERGKAQRQQSALAVSSVVFVYVVLRQMQDAITPGQTARAMAACSAVLSCVYPKMLYVQSSGR